MNALVERLRALRVAMVAEFAPYCGELTVSQALTVPTSVIETNGKTVGEDKRTVRWTIHLTDLADPAKLTQFVTFADAPTLKLEPFTMGAPEPATAPEPSQDAPARSAPASDPPPDAPSK